MINPPAAASSCWAAPFNMKAAARDIRKSRAHTGYIFQQFNLVNRLTVLENVLIGALGSTPFWRTCFSWFSQNKNSVHYRR